MDAALRWLVPMVNLQLQIFRFWSGPWVWSSGQVLTGPSVNVRTGEVASMDLVQTPPYFKLVMK